MGCKETSTTVFLGKISLFLKKGDMGKEGPFQPLYISRPGYDSWNFTKPATSLKRESTDGSGQSPENCRERGPWPVILEASPTSGLFDISDKKLPCCLNKIESDFYFT